MGGGARVRLRAKENSPVFLETVGTGRVSHAGPGWQLGPLFPAQLLASTFAQLEMELRETVQRTEGGAASWARGKDPTQALLLVSTT